MRVGVLIAAAFLALFFSFPAFAQQQEPVIGLEGAPNPPTFQGEKPGWAQFIDPYAADMDNLAKANRTVDEIVEWAGGAVADTLTFKVAKDKDAVNAQIRNSQKYFDPVGWPGYAGFLQSSKIFEALTSGTYSAMAISDGAPFILSSGVQDGKYQWKVNVPVIVSVLQPPDPAATADENGELPSPRSIWTNKTTVRVTLSRVTSGGRDGLAIVNWEEAPKK